MPKFVIERDIPGAGKLSDRDLKALARKSLRAIEQMSSPVQWVQSYMTADKTYCVYIAPDEALLREHAEHGGFPISRISLVTSIIDPTTAE
jgi:hypothetical protein